MKVLFRDSAADWLESLPQASTMSYNALREEFEKRFKAAQVLRFRNAKHFVSSLQQITRKAT